MSRRLSGWRIGPAPMLTKAILAPRRRAPRHPEQGTGHAPGAGAEVVQDAGTGNDQKIEPARLPHRMHPFPILRKAPGDAGPGCPAARFAAAARRSGWRRCRAPGAPAAGPPQMQESRACGMSRRSNRASPPANPHCRDCRNRTGRKAQWKVAVPDRGWPGPAPHRARGHAARPTSVADGVSSGRGCIGLVMGLNTRTQSAKPPPLVPGDRNVVAPEARRACPPSPEAPVAGSYQRASTRGPRSRPRSTVTGRCVDR